MPDSIASYAQGAPVIQASLASERAAGGLNAQQTQSQNKQNEAVKARTTVNATSQTASQSRDLVSAQDGQDVSAAVANGSSARGSIVDISV